MPTLSGLIAKRFIAQPQYYAVQTSTGAWHPSRAYDTDSGKYDGPLQPFSAKILSDHLEGRSTIGHYMVNRDNQTKLFAFDLDFVDRDAPWIRYPGDKDMEALQEKFGDDPERLEAAWEHLIKLGRQTGNPRELWQNKKHPSRAFYLRQMRGLVELLTQRIHAELGVPVAAAWSGNKGAHVYAFHGLLSAGESRALAVEILESFDRFELVKGKNFWGDTVTDADSGFPTVEIECFPKQDSVGEDGFGNLMALPLGINRKAPGSKKFFIDQRAPHATIVPHPDPFALLNSGNPWE